MIGSRSLWSQFERTILHVICPRDILSLSKISITSEIQYWGDVTPYQAQVEALTASVEGKTAELAEKDEQLAKKDEALAAANGLLAELEATYDEN